MKFRDIIKESLDLKNDRLLQTRSGERAFSWNGQNSIGGDVDEYIKELDKKEEAERKGKIEEADVTVSQLWEQAKEAENVKGVFITRKDKDLFEAEVRFKSGNSTTFECTE